MPFDHKDFQEDAKAQKNPRTYIVKPNAEAQGRGIYLTREFNKIKAIDNVII